MDMNAKYLTVVSNAMPIPEMYIFPRHIKHQFFAHALSHDYAGMLVVSAGSIMLRGGEPICYGESVSLGVKSDPEKDSALANKMFGGQ